MDRIKSVNRVFLATILISIAGSFLNDLVSMYTDNDLVLLLISQIILVIPSIAYLSIHKMNVRKTIRFNKINFSNIMLIIVFAYLITPLMNLINAISLLFVQNDISNVMNNITEKNSFLISLFMVAFVPCILEESVYRGIFYSEYSKINPLKGILLSAFLFGLMHGNLNQFSYAFAMGIVFALLIEATNSILATMVVHFIINGTSILLLEVYPKLLHLLERMYGSEKFNAKELMDTLQTGATEKVNIDFVIQYGLTAIIPTILAFIVYRTIAKNSGRWEYVKRIFSSNARINTNDTSEENYLTEPISMESAANKVGLFTWSLWIGIAVCVFILISNELFTSSVPEQPLEELTTSVFYLCNQWIR
jgi:membrane protease YdiL (CAAX protease family)